MQGSKKTRMDRREEKVMKMERRVKDGRKQ